MLALMGIVNGVGTDVVAAYTAAGRLDSLAIIPSMVFSTALSTFVGQNIGAGKNERVKKGLSRTLIMAKTGRWKTRSVIKARVEPATVTR